MQVACKAIEIQPCLSEKKGFFRILKGHGNDVLRSGKSKQEETMSLSQFFTFLAVVYAENVKNI